MSAVYKYIVFLLVKECFLTNCYSAGYGLFRIVSKQSNFRWKVSNFASLIDIYIIRYVKFIRDGNKQKTVH